MFLLNTDIDYSWFSLPFDVWYLIDLQLFRDPVSRSRLRQVCHATARLDPLCIPKTPHDKTVIAHDEHCVDNDDGMFMWQTERHTFAPDARVRTWVSYHGVCAHCLKRDKLDNMRAMRRTGLDWKYMHDDFKPIPTLFYRCWECHLMTDYQRRLTLREWSLGALIVRLKWTEFEPELRKNGLAHCVQSYEDAVCSQQPTPKGYKIAVGFSKIDLGPLYVSIDRGEF